MWEKINNNDGIERLKVPGGWLVKHREIVSARPVGIVGAANRGVQQVNMAMCFMPDPRHEWGTVDKVSNLTGD